MVIRELSNPDFSVLPQASVQANHPSAETKTDQLQFDWEQPPHTSNRFEDARTRTESLTDLVQDLYLKELKAYKAPAVKASDAEGQVQKFSLPKPPPSPEEADIANDLKAYESQVPEVEGQSGGEGAPVQDWFEEEVEEEESHGGH